jgi:hypothetical protein
MIAVMMAVLRHIRLFVVVRIVYGWRIKRGITPPEKPKEDRIDET